MKTPMVISRPARRGPLLALTAAAMALAIAVTPAAATRTAPPGPGVQAVEPRQVDPSPDGPWLTLTDGPIPIAEFTEDGRRWSVVASLERHPAGAGWAHRACVVAVPPGAPPGDPNRHPRSIGCAGLSDWPAESPSKVHARSVLHSGVPGGGPLPGLLLFITVPEVSRLDVRGAYGEPATVTELARTADLAVYLADFGGSSVGFGYTATDAAGTVIEAAIS